MLRDLTPTAGSPSSKGQSGLPLQKAGSKKATKSASTDLVLHRKLEQLENVFERDATGAGRARSLLLGRLTVLLLLRRLTVLLLGRLTVLLLVLRRLAVLLLGLTVLLLAVPSSSVTASATDWGRWARGRCVTRLCKAVKVLINNS